ncbi:hypothetical protein F5144DRAFT_510880 [Chaetomium tenue]|uniref:Uncharacterized protein n=1 Tax=Chaetomium tenue TaxID=1854479 RepID=A0ACB7P5P2_9PEZI|nr:hypothetical protein F5144DRAFT_510880 [Chaetomium globosum]
MFSALFCFTRPSSSTRTTRRSHVTAGTRECVICCESRAPAAFPNGPVTAGCSHTPGACLDCLSASIRAHVDRGFSTDVPCPECPGTMSFADTQRYADAETRHRYDELCLRHMLQGDKNFVWCAAGCGNGQIHDSGATRPIVKCFSCAKNTCFVCRVPWHSGMTCREWSLSMAPTADDVPEHTKSRKAQELRASKVMIYKTTKKCPRCMCNIERNGGCIRMTCIACGCRFCWECQADLWEIGKKGDSVHRQGCSFR